MTADVPLPAEPPPVSSGTCPVPGSRYVLFAALALGGAAWDLYTKQDVFERFGHPAGCSKPYLTGFVKFRLFTSFNEGALGGLGWGWSGVFAALSVVAALVILYWLFLRRAACSLWLTVALGLIMAGTLGNLYDRLGFHGYINHETGTVRHAVRDFLHFQFGTYHWPVFNFADVFLVTGAMMLVAQSLVIEFRGQAPSTT